MPTYHSDQPFSLESGKTLPKIKIAYEVYGDLNRHHDRVIWVCHALTANAAVADWWPGLFGAGKLLDPEKNVIICANIMGSCYGTAGPADINPETGSTYAKDWPLITIRDMVSAHILLANHLHINQIDLLIGGSLGGMQAIEWAIMQPERINKLCLLATSARHTAWGIAWNATQRMSLFADATFWNSSLSDFGRAGLAAARAVAMISYRTYEGYNLTQTDKEPVESPDLYRAATYQQYQGEKLYNRFHPWAYLSLTHSMDSHDVGRGRGSVESALQRINADTFIIGIKSDILFPLDDQQFLARHIPKAIYHEIESRWGHDGFLIESEAIINVMGVKEYSGI
jgi:homoserine O-acetyltransferase/O-succinyltransferase